MKKILCILMSVVLIAGTGVISANAVVSPDTHMASMSAQLQEELADTSTDTVQVIFYLYDYTAFWEMEAWEFAEEKFGYPDNDWTDSDYERFQKYYDIEMSRMIAEYNLQFCYAIAVEQYCPVHVDKVIFSSRKEPYVVVEAQKDKVEQMAKHYTDVESMDLFNGYLPNDEDINSPFMTDFDGWTYINNRWLFEQDPDDIGIDYPPYYTYSDLYIHNKDGKDFHPDWVLCQARYIVPEPLPIIQLWIGGAGGRFIQGGSIQSPFEFGYGVYDVEENKYYGLEEIAGDYSKYDGLIDALAEKNIGTLLGDVNGDNTVDILDATVIQKYAADKTDLSYEQEPIADVNGDYFVDVIDATEIQKYAAA